MKLKSGALRRFPIIVPILVVAPAANAGITLYEEGDKKIVVGGRMQIQYNSVDPDGGSSEDEIIFRRLRPYIEGTVTKDWLGKIQVDFGKSSGDNEVAVKDAYFQYLGWDNMKLTIGNSKTPFSREFLASSKRQQTVERAFVGDHNFGTPDRQVGLKLTGQNDDKRITWAAAAGFENHDPDASKVDFDTPANDSSDWNQGRIIAGRVDFHPFGFQKFDQGDFGRSQDFTATIGVAAFLWANDDDSNTYTDPATGLSTSTSRADLDESSGIELSAGLRGRGISVDAEIQIIEADAVDSTFTGGVYQNGSTELEKFQIEGGYMFPNKQVEIVGRVESMDADNFADAWEAWELGLNYFWNKHKTKVQFTYRHGENVNGVDGAEADTFFTQFQFVF